MFQEYQTERAQQNLFSTQLMIIILFMPSKIIIHIKTCISVRFKDDYKSNLKLIFRTA